MRGFVLLSCCLALASARPEAGYSYNRPSGGSHSGGGGGGGYSSGGHGGGGGGGGHGGGSFSSGGGSSGFSSFGGSGFGGSSSFSSGGASSFGGGSSSFGGGASSFGGGSSSFGGGSSSFGGFSGGSQQAIIQKHIYVHVPPPEPEEVRIQRPLQVAPAQKHYKIIFIKAPSAPAYQAPQIPIQPQNEEKTLVYVLVKKPDEQQDIVIPTPAPTQPSKPEVYFIKYKTQKEGGAGGFVGSVGGGFSDAIGGGGGAIGGHDSGSGDLSGGHGATAPAAQYGPPGKSGPY